MSNFNVNQVFSRNRNIHVYKALDKFIPKDSDRGFSSRVPKPSHRFFVRALVRDDTVSLALAVAQARPELMTRPVTFASPKLGTARIAKALGELGLVRIEVEGDIVPSLPPWPFRHGGDALTVEVASRPRPRSRMEHDRRLYSTNRSYPGFRRLYCLLLHSQ